MNYHKKSRNKKTNKLLVQRNTQVGRAEDRKMETGWSKPSEREPDLPRGYLRTRIFVKAKTTLSAIAYCRVCVAPRSTTASLRNYVDAVRRRVESKVVLAA